MFAPQVGSHIALWWCALLRHAVAFRRLPSLTMTPGALLCSKQACQQHRPCCKQGKKTAHVHVLVAAGSGTHKCTACISSGNRDCRSDPAAACERVVLELIKAPAAPPADSFYLTLITHSTSAAQLHSCLAPHTNTALVCTHATAPTHPMPRRCRATAHRRARFARSAYVLTTMGPSTVLLTTSCWPCHLAAYSSTCCVVGR